MGRRRRRVIRIVKKKLPTVFVCPKCGEETVRVTIAKDTGRATVLCALGCGFRDDFPAHPAAQMIDVYSYAADRFYGVKDPRPIMPKEREKVEAVIEEEPEEPPPAQTAIVEFPEQPPMVVPKEEEPVVPVGSAEPVTPTEPVEVDVAGEKVKSPDVEAGVSAEEEAEPFADILQNKDKKRYSPNPLPQEQSE